MTDPTTPDRDAIRARAEAAIKLRALHEDTADMLVYWGASILEMVADIPALLAALDEARAEAERYRGMFERCLESENRAQADLAVAEARAAALEATLATVRAEHTRDRERLAKVEALVDRSESRVDIAHRLVTTDTLRAVLTTTSEEAER